MMRLKLRFVCLHDLAVFGVWALLFSGKLFVIKLHYIHSFKYGGVQL